MAEPGYVFTTIALLYKTRRYPPAGFFCLWDDELTFVHSKYVQFVYLPMSNFGITVLPDRVRPTGSEDTRTRFRIPYADLEQVTWVRKWAQVLVHTRSGEDHYFGGGSVNSGFRFEAVAAEITKALEAAGYAVNAAENVLTVHHGPG